MSESDADEVHGQQLAYALRELNIEVALACGSWTRQSPADRVAIVQSLRASGRDPVLALHQARSACQALCHAMHAHVYGSGREATCCGM